MEPRELETWWPFRVNSIVRISTGDETANSWAPRGQDIDATASWTLVGLILGQARVKPSPLRPCCVQYKYRPSGALLYTTRGQYGSPKVHTR
jgi:hypothetical protein